MKKFKLLALIFLIVLGGIFLVTAPVFALPAGMEFVGGIFISPLTNPACLTCAPFPLPTCYLCPMRSFVFQTFEYDFATGGISSKTRILVVSPATSGIPRPGGFYLGIAKRFDELKLIVTVAGIAL